MSLCCNEKNKEMKPVKQKDSFGLRVKNLRLEKGLSQSDLAEIMGTSNIMISRYERNEVKPTIDVLIRFAYALETKVAYLVGESKITLDPELSKIVEDILSFPEDRQRLLRSMIASLLRTSKEDFAPTI